MRFWYGLVTCSTGNFLLSCLRAKYSQLLRGQKDIECIADAKASNVCEPCLNARVIECLSKLQGSSQCAIMPIKLLLLAVQQPVFVAMYVAFFIASFTYSFIVIVAESILCTVHRDMTTYYGCKSQTSLWNDGCSTREKGLRPMNYEAGYSIVNRYLRHMICFFKLHLFGN